MAVYVLKASGERAEYNPNKLKKTLMRAGASSSHAQEIVDQADNIVYDGMPTKELLKKVLSMLRSEPKIAGRYDLKGALFRLGPTGFTFEQVMARILNEYGYTTKTNLLMKGKCVSHEVDILADNGKESAFIECKYHNEAGIYTNLHVSMYTWARFIDLSEGAKAKLCDPVDSGWLITNTKFSEDASKFGTCRGLRMTGWNFPKNEGLQYMIEQKSLWPVTLLKVDKFILEALSEARLLLIKDIVDQNPDKLARKLGIPRPKVDRLINDARAFM